MTAPVSVVVVSRGRPRELARCLKGLRQLYYPSFEVVVVADGATLPGIEPFPGLRTVSFDQPNISAARNIGIGEAGGEVVAFIDDDAVPEPTWLDHLVPPLADRQVAAAGGYVVGRNGLSLQWGAMSLDAEGWSHPLAVEGEEVQVFSTAPGGQAIRTQGTNMALRRETLVSLGGFDEAFHFYHEDADLNLRIAREGLLTAVVPRARVHHATAPSARRRRDRAPLSLFDIGASSAVFHRKYLAEREWARAREDLRAAQRRRLIAMLTDGRIEPKAFEQLSKSLLRGYDEGLMRRSGVRAEIADPPDFTPAPRPAPRHEVLTGGWSHRRRMRAEAREAVAEGAVATLIALDPTARFHKVAFTEDGVWEQTGGRFGRSDRTGPLIRRIGLGDRLTLEAGRAAAYRGPPPG